MGYSLSRMMALWKCRVPGAKQKTLFFSELLRDWDNNPTDVDVAEWEPISMPHRALF